MLQDRIAEISAFVCSNEGRLRDFRASKALSLISASDVAASERNGYRVLEHLFRRLQNGTLSVAAIAHQSDVEVVEKGRPTLESLTLHLMAYTYLCEAIDQPQYRYHHPLTVTVLLETHKTLLKNPARGIEPQNSAGTFRTRDAYDGDWVYIPPDRVPAEVQRVVDVFNASVQEKRDPIHIAAHLFYGLLAAHPFEDGNTRVCHLLVAFAFFATGTPFPVSLVATKKECEHAMMAARSWRADFGPLYALFALSLDLGWTNVAAYCSDVHVSEK